jgi:hypothetical protein
MAASCASLACARNRGSGMSWGDESWQQAARDYQAGRKQARHRGIIHMDLEREMTDAEIIPLRKHREQQE